MMYNVNVTDIELPLQWDSLLESSHFKDPTRGLADNITWVLEKHTETVN
jgi:hypothetical protein